MTPQASTTPTGISIWLWVLGIGAAFVFWPSGLCVLRRGVRLGWRFTPPVGIMSAVLVMLGGMLGVLAAKGASTAATGLGLTVLLMGAGWAGQAFVLGGLLWLGCIRPTATDTGGHRRATLSQAVVMGIVGLALFWPMCLLITAFCGNIAAIVTGEPPDILAHSLLHDLLAAGPGPLTWSIVAAVVVCPPIFEEVLYRGLVQESLRRVSFGRQRAAWMAVGMTSLLFTFMHVGTVAPHALPGLFLLSVGFGWVVAWTGRLTAGVVMHAGFNLGNVLMAVPWITG